MDKKEVFKLVLVVLLALFLRFYRLSDVPVGFHGDEASIGYNAYSLLKTARDQNGNFLPIAIDQFGDFRPAGYHYLTIPSVALFGLTEFATRLPSALIGSFSVIPFFFLILQIFRKKNLALLSSFILAISPWHIALSRATSESIVALFLVLWGVYYLLRYHTHPTTGFIWRAGISLLLSFFFYHSARLFVPLLVLCFVLLVLRKEKKDLRIRNTLFWFGGAVIISSAIIFFVSSGLGRAGQVTILRAPGEMQELRQQVSEDGGISVWVVRALHNKVTFYLTTVSKNYFEHFTPNFLFLDGGQPVRYRVPWTGVMYLVDGVMVFLGFVGLVVLVTLKKDRIVGLPIIWLLLAPLPAALTFGELPSVQRALFMLPALILLSAYGIYIAVNLFIGKLRILIVGILIVAYGYLGTVFLHNYFHHSFTHEPWYRNAGEKELVFEIDRYTREGKKVIMTSQNDNNLIFYLFYLRFEPKEFQRMGSPRDRDNLVFGNMTFTYKHCPLEGSDKDNALGELGVIYVNRGECKIPKNSELIKDIKWPDSSLAFRILQLKE